MAINITWKIEKSLIVQSKNDLNDVVVSVSLNVSASDGVNTRDMNIIVKLNEPGPDFIPYNELQEEQVIAWAKATIPEDEQNKIETVLTNAVTKASTQQPVALAFKSAPWSTCVQGG